MHLGSSLPTLLCLAIAAIGFTADRAAGDQPVGFADRWTKSELGGVRETFTIFGTGDRNNPLRRPLAEPFSGDELFVQFRLNYHAASVDTPGNGDGEFFVLWMDSVDGGDRATHAGGVPNVGVHVAEGDNRFMVRYHAGDQQFSKLALRGDQTYQVAARLRKTVTGAAEPFDRLDLWIDPAPHMESSPHVSVSSRGAPAEIRWIGFSTGRKTEQADRIAVSDLRVATTWREMLGLPEPTPLPSDHQPEPTPRTVKRTIEFEQHVLPILKQHCFGCHSGAEAVSGLRLDVLDEVLNQVSLQNVKASRLIELVSTTDENKRMPPIDHEALSDQQIATLRRWIIEGLSWNEQLLPTPAPQTDHWSFQPISRPAIPKVKHSSWVRTPVDAFVARRHQAAGLKPAPAASPMALARRLSLDLTGLPYFGDLSKQPSDGHVFADRLMQELLSSPEYGQRWGRHWLDLARWGESNGHQHNRDRPHAWRYRDYVIRSFQHDKPFDRFIQEQIAGDELPFSEEALIATGFLAAARYSGNELDAEIQRNDILVDVVNTTAKSILGITLECAQCHSHKFDSFSIRDYYQFQAFFANGQPGNLVLRRQSGDAKTLIAARWKMFDDVHARLVLARRKKGYPDPILVIPKSVFSGMKGVEREYFDRMETEIGKLPQTWGWYSPASGQEEVAIAPHQMRWPLPREPEVISQVKTYLRIRGDVQSPGPQVDPAWPAVFGATPSGLEKPRTALAAWMTSVENPLTARVWVNRIWQWHFGRGLVRSSGDFGTQGTTPTHPLLLDWLASELIDSGWSTRHIHELILRSNTYRQSPAFSAANHQTDPENELLWRWQPRRLEAEAIRDTALAVAGQLDRKTGGPSVPRSESAKSRRRSVYLQQKRDLLPESLTLFDAPGTITSCSRRRTSTVALQPLYLLNSPFMNDLAIDFARRVKADAAGQADQVTLAIRLALGRQPDAEEVQRGSEYLSAHSLEDFCHALMNLSEFVYIH